MKKLHVAHSQEQGEIFPGSNVQGMVTHMWVEDEDGNKISDIEMEKLFLNFEAVGYWVKRKLPVKKAHEKYSHGGLVTSITDKEVFLNGKESVPRSLFHQIYVLD